MVLEPSRSAFLTDLMATLGSNPAYSAEWGSDTDLTISSNSVHGTWGVGKKRVEYSAALNAVEPEHTVYFWEVLKGRSSGLDFETVESESAVVGKKLSGTRSEEVVGPGADSWQWGYGTLRALIEEVAARHGFTVKVVLMRHSATW